MVHRRDCMLQSHFLERISKFDTSTERVIVLFFRLSALRYASTTLSSVEWDVYSGTILFDSPAV